MKESYEPLSPIAKFFIALIFLGFIVSFGQLFFDYACHTCDECGESFIGASYYDYTETMTLCEDCARTYWMPLPYKNYKR